MEELNTRLTNDALATLTSMPRSAGKSFTMLTQALQRRYGIERIIKDSCISKEMLAECFLLGASFDLVAINGHEWRVMIYQNTLYILFPV